MQDFALGTPPGRFSRAVVMVLAGLLGVLFILLALFIALGFGEGEGAGRVTMPLMAGAFGYVLLVGARHFGQKAFAARVRLGTSAIEIRRPLHRTRRIPLEQLAGVGGGVRNISVNFDGNVGTETVEVLQIRLQTGKTVSLYAPDGAMRQQAAEALRALLAASSPASSAPTSPSRS